MGAYNHWAKRSIVAGTLIAISAAVALIPSASFGDQPGQASPDPAAQPAQVETAPAAAPPTPAALPQLGAAPPASAADAAPATEAPTASDSPAATTAPSVAPRPAADRSRKKVQLEFRNQQWLPVLQWLADTLNLNLDWQQLPDGTVNLTSAGEYTVEEAEDLINMQLLARGYTLLTRGEVLRVAPLKDLDITLVPRVEVDQLRELPRHKFVRVTFPLDWMIAEEAAAEFKPLVSPYGQLLPMGSSNRLEAIDAVVNLRELNRLLKGAETDKSRRERVVEFRLKHREAGDVAANVRQLLGVATDTAPAAATQSQVDIEKLKFKSEAIKQLGAEAKPLLVEKGGPQDVHVVVNELENSILVSGRPDKIELARQAVEAMDKPEPTVESPWETLNRVKTYSVAGFDPSTVSQLLQALKDRRNLQKDTQIQHDTMYNRLVVVASAEDQLTVAKIIESFRTEGRRAEVLPLAEIDARYATKAIQLVLKNPARPAQATGPPSEGQFQIEADPTHNRLLLWATPEETAEVRDFLTELGETFIDKQPTAKVHVIQLHGAKAAEVLERLKRTWQEISNAPLLTEEEPSAPPTPNSTPPATDPNQPSGPPPATELPAEPMSEQDAKRLLFRLIAQQQPVPPAGEAQQQPAPQAVEAQPNQPAPGPATAPASAPEPAPAEPMPVRVIAGRDEDEMVIISRDPANAQAAKDVLEHLLPEAPEVEIITLKHAQAGLVKTQLEALLRPDVLADTASLSTQKPLWIEADSRVNRLLIQHATPRQLELIKEIIPMLDQPTQEDERLVRQQRIYRAKRKRAQEIAEVVKEVYRDLLSTSDKVFDSRMSNRPFGYNRAMAATSKSPEYQGLLSVGVDTPGNMLVLSAPAYLMDEVMGLVERIDSEAAGESMVVVPVSRAAQPKLGEALGRLLAKPQ